MTLLNDQIFTLYFSQSLTIDQTIIEWSNHPRPLPLKLEMEIDRYWQSLAKEHLYNGGIVRLDDWRLADNRLILFLRPSDYRTLLHSNSRTDEILREWGADRLSRALGISAVLTSIDERLFFIRRSELVGEFPGAWDLFGGHIEPPKSGKPDIFAAMAKELEEEAGLRPEETQLHIIGLVESIPNRKPELIFSSRSRLTAEQIVERVQTAADRGEFTALESIPLQRHRVAEVLNDRRRQWSPSAYASLALYYELIECS